MKGWSEYYQKAFSHPPSFLISSAPRVNRTIAVQIVRYLEGGKSGLHRVECQVTPGGREPTEESAAENIPPKAFGPGKVEMVR